MTSLLSFSIFFFKFLFSFLLHQVPDNLFLFPWSRSFFFSSLTLPYISLIPFPPPFTSPPPLITQFLALPYMFPSQSKKLSSEFIHRYNYLSELCERRESLDGVRLDSPCGHFGYRPRRSRRGRILINYKRPGSPDGVAPLTAQCACDRFTPYACTLRCVLPAYLSLQMEFPVYSSSIP
ncbi:hypothetical protein GGR50DRAFT_450402 [Xylaria sp. CBS 124048]|nr:hypothetical protein GGR50DRAFT_450402 [Xylaria sp. CBS 124048]